MSEDTTAAAIESVAAATPDPAVEQAKTSGIEAAPEGEAPADAAKPAEKKAEETQLERITRLAKARSDARKTKVAAQRAAQSFSAREAQLAQMQRQIEQEAELLRTSPMDWAHRRVGADTFAKAMIDRPMPTAEDKIAQLEQRLAEFQQSQQQRELQAQRQQVMAQIEAGADEFVKFVEEHSEEYDALSCWPDMDTREAWRQLQMESQRTGVRYSRRQIAEKLNAFVRPHVEKAAQRFAQRLEKRAPDSTTAASQSKATAAATKGGTRTTTGITGISSSSPDFKRLPEKEQYRILQAEYDAMMAGRGR